MIKNDKGKIEISAQKVQELMLEWMQLTSVVQMAIKEGTGVEMNFEMMVEYGTKILTEKLDE